MRNRQLKRLGAAQTALADEATHQELLMKLGAVRSQYPSDWQFLVLEKFAAVQRANVEIPTADARTITLTRHTDPEPNLKLLLERLQFELPAQPPPKITVAQAETATLA